MADSQHTFYGRANELDLLMHEWQSVKVGNPIWVSIVAESGVGKTRLVQEFYAHLAEQHREEVLKKDIENRGLLSGEQLKTRKAWLPYWPPTLPLDDLRLSINPRFDSEMQSAHELPWLWWGIRGKDPDDRNPTESTCALRQALEHLEPHLMEITFAIAEKDVRQEIGKKIGNLLSGGLLDPLISMAELLQGRSRYVEELKKLNLNVPERIHDKNRDLATTVCDSLMMMLDKHVPIVLVLDDLHFFDAESKQFLRQFLSRFNDLLIPKLKLMIISTSWVREWSEGDDPPATLWKEWGSDKHTMPLTGLDRDSSIAYLKARLPGLTSNNLTTITDRADGNFRYLIELCLELICDPDTYFVGSDSKSALTENGLEQLADEKMDFDRLVRKRINGLDKFVRETIETSSYQGPRFDPDLSASVVCRLISGVTRDTASKALQQAETPGAVIATGEIHTKDFLQGPYWRIVHERIKSSNRHAAIQNAYKETLDELDLTKVDQLSAPMLSALERYALKTDNADSKSRIYGALLKSSAASRRYDAALTYVLQIYHLLDHVSPNVVNQADLDHITMQFTALDVITHFGYRPPVGAEINIDEIEQMGGLFAASLAKVLTEGGNYDIPLTDRITLSKTLLDHATAFWYIHEMRRWSSLYARLTREYASDTTKEGVTDNDLVRAVLASLESIELEESDKKSASWFRGGILFHRLDSLIERLSSNSLKSILLSLINAFMLHYGKIGQRHHPVPHPWPEEDAHYAFSLATRQMEDVLYSLVHHDDLNDSQTDGLFVGTLNQRFDTVTNSNRDAMVALLKAGSIVVEYALEEGIPLAAELTDRLLACTQAVTSQLHQGAYFSAEAAASCLDSLLVITRFYRHRADIVDTPHIETQTDDAEDDWLEQLKDASNVVFVKGRSVTEQDAQHTSRLLLDVTRRYRQLAGGHVRIMRLMLITGNYLIESMKSSGINREAVQKDVLEILKHAIDDAIACQDGKRGIFGETVVLLPWIIRTINRFGDYLPDLEVTKRHIREAYYVLNDEQYEKLISS